MNKVPISGFTILRNGESFGYPYLQSLSSLLPFVTELIILLDPGTDNTQQKLEKWIQSERDALKKVRLILTHWPLEDEEKRKGGLILSEQTQLALEACQYDWCFYLQADEVFHENSKEHLTTCFERTLQEPSIEAWIFQYEHFYGSYGVVQRSRSAYRREVRMVRKSAGIKSVGDAQSFRHSSDRKLQAALTDLLIHHYGWVRPPEVMAYKTQFMDSLYHSQGGGTGENHRYKRIWGLEDFRGSHPKVMDSWIANKGWDWDYRRAPWEFSRKDLTKVPLDLLERATGMRLFEYRSYQIQSDWRKK